MSGLLLLTWFPSRPAHAFVDRVLFVTEVVSDADSPPGRQDLYVDPVFFAARSRVYAALNLGSFARGLEVGLACHDHRRSSYTTFLRRRQGGVIDDTAFEVATSQVVGRIVGQASLRLQWPDHPDGDNLLFIPALGAELYTGDYSFSAFRAIVDPRPGTGIAFLLSHRLASRQAFLEVALVPRTDGVLNYGIRGRWRYLYAGFSHEQDFDYSRIDRDVWSIGIQYDLDS